MYMLKLNYSNFKNQMSHFNFKGRNQKKNHLKVSLLIYTHNVAHMKFILRIIRNEHSPSTKVRSHILVYHSVLFYVIFPCYRKYQIKVN